MKKGLCTILLVAFGLMSMSIFVKTDRMVSAKRENIDEFLLGSWVSYYDTQIRDYKQQTEDMAKSGLNWVILPQPDMHKLNGMPSMTNSEWQDVNDAFAASGMQFLMHANSDIES